MTAPTVVLRGTPDGVRLKDGYQTLFAFELDNGVALWEKTVTPPGLDGGDAIDTTTMHNVTYRTMASRALITLTESSFTAAYDPSMYDSILALCNVEQAITCHFPDGSTLTFYGYLKSFIPGANVEGTQPEGTATIVPTNTDPDTGTEEAPVYAAATGTA